MPLLSELPWGCLIASIGAKARLLAYILPKTQDEAVAPSSSDVRAIAESLGSTCADLEELDPAFYAAGPFPLRPLKNEELNRRRLIPTDQITHGLDIVSSALMSMARHGRRWLPDSPDASWKAHAFTAACAAWRIRRWQRLTLQQTDYSKEQIDQRYYREMEALSFAMKIGAFAGEHIKSAGLAWVFQTLYAWRLPINAKTQRPLGLDNWQFGSARQVGITPDEFFRGDWKSAIATAQGVGRVKDPEVLPVPAKPTPRTPTPQEQRFLDHRHKNADLWAPLAPLVEDRAQGFEANFRLDKAVVVIGELLEKGLLDPATLQPAVRSLLRIFLDLKCARSAMNMLHCLEHVDAKAHLLPTARLVSECVRTNQVAVSNEFMNEFLERTTNGWRRCSNQPVSRQERLLLHELVLGRYSAIYSSVSPRAYRELLKNRLNSNEKPDYASILNEQEDAFRLGPPALTEEDLEVFVRGQRPGGVGSPVMVSVLPLAGGASVVAYGQKIGLKGFFEPGLILDEATGRMLSRREAWFRASDEVCPPEHQVVWTKDFKSLRATIQSLATANGSRWIMLAVDPKMACLPWQHLFSCSGDDQSKDLLVTLCPNLAWAPMAVRRAGGPNPRDPVRLICQSDDPAVVDARERIGPLLESTSSDFDMGVVLGHGSLRVSEAPQISLDDQVVGLEGFCDLIRHEVAVVHSCWTASAHDPKLWGDGMLVSHLLARNCRAVCAPVGQVSPEAVEAFHAALTRGTGGSLGVRYLRAIKVDPSVSLYSLHGLASIPPMRRETPSKALHSGKVPPHAEAA